jgi:hypothetical protein
MKDVSDENFASIYMAEAVATCFILVFFDPENGGDAFLLNVG